MCQKKNNSVAAGLFTKNDMYPDNKSLTSKKELEKKETKKIGRPRASDIKSEDTLVRVAYYLTPEQRKKVRVKSSEQDADSSKIIRELIDQYL